MVIDSSKCFAAVVKGKVAIVAEVVGVTVGLAEPEQSVVVHDQVVCPKEDHIEEIKRTKTRRDEEQKSL